MTDYREYSTAEVIAESMSDLKFIGEKFGSRQYEDGSPRMILIGGWAVDAYNPWFGSIDIDIITSSKMREKIEYALLEERGFQRRERQDDTTMVVRRIDENKEIIIDFMVKEKLNPFEGRQEGIIYSILEGRTAEKTCRGEVPVHVPKRAPLAFLKMKAAWDRKYRVDHGTSHDETWERGKIEKDRCDIMALADPSGGGREIDLREFAELAHPYPFLLEVLEQVKEDQNAIRRYRKMNPREVAEVVDVLIDQAWS